VLLFVSSYISFWRSDDWVLEDQSRLLLEQAGYKRLSEAEPWSIVPGGKYFFTRSQSSIVAFAVGGKYVRDCVIMHQFDVLD
jgi:aspartyl aminopeptidase